MSGTDRLSFDGFTLDPANRSLHRDNQQLALNSRYFDALVLLVREHGRLVAKQRFFDEVWTGSVVTDAALTQCIKDIRRVLGDSAGAPRFIRTVQGHGYCFIAPVTIERPISGAAAGAEPASADAFRNVEQVQSPLRAPVGDDRSWVRVLAGGVAGGVGGAAAGLIGGILYGSALAVSPQAPGLGTSSVVLVLLALSMIVGLAGGLGVGLGLAFGRQLGDAAGWMLAGGALGGFGIGTLARLLGSDTFVLLVGNAPGGITGGVEGAAIGLAVAAGLHLGRGARVHRRRTVPIAVITTAAAGALIPLAGGSMMATSLAQVAATFESSRLDMTPLGALLGEPQFGPAVQSALGALEGGLFGGCVAAGLLWMQALSLGRRRETAPGADSRTG